MLLKKAEEKKVEEVMNPYDWPDNYYMETDPEKRKTILDAQTNSDEAEINKLRDELWNVRYEKMRNGRIKDCFLAAWLDLMILSRQMDGTFGKRKVMKPVLNNLKDLQLQQVERYGKELLLEELKHMVLLYCCASMEDRQYGSVIFGFGKMKQENIKKKIRADLYAIGTEIPQKLELSKEMALLTEAINLAEQHLGLND